MLLLRKFIHLRDSVVFRGGITLHWVGHIGVSGGGIDCIRQPSVVKTGLKTFEADGHGVEGEGAKEIAPHALFDLDEGAGGAIDPVDREALGEVVEFGGEVEVADEGGGSGDDEEEIFNEAAEGAEEVDGFQLAVGAGAVGFGGVEEL